MNFLRSILIAVSVLGAAFPAGAALTGTLSPSVQNSAAGAELVFSGTVTNTSSSENLFLNDVRVDFTGNAVGNFGADSNLFFAAVPGILLPDEVYEGELFRVALKNTAPSADYAGTVTFQGGTNIFATNDLFVTGFSVLSPAVSLAVAIPFASEFGPVAGAITVARTGGTSIDLSVQLDIAGTAANGVTYQPISTVFTIPAGVFATNIVVTPISDDVVQGDRLAILTLSNSAAYNLSANSNATVIIRDKPVDIWRLQHFGVLANSPAAADKGDWDGDGRANLLEYALNLSSTNAEAEPVLVPTTVNDYLTLSYVPSLTALDVVLFAESSTNLAAWSTNDVETVTIPNPIPPERITVRYKYPISQTGPAYLRLKTRRGP